MASLYELQQSDAPTVAPHLQKALDINAAARSTYDRISSDPNLTPAGKQKKLAPIYLATKKQMTDHQAAVTAATANRKAQLARTAFGVPTDPIQAMSYRNAVGLAEQVDNPRIAGEKLSRALDTGDPLMAQAIAQHAADNGWQDVLNTYLAAKPSVGDALNELNQINAQQNDAGAQFRNAMYYQVAKPSELDRLQDHQIEQLVSDQTSA